MEDDGNSVDLPIRVFNTILKIEQNTKRWMALKGLKRNLLTSLIIPT